MPKIKWTEISIGNVITVLITLGGLGGSLIAFTHNVDAVQSQIDQTTVKHEMRLEVVEKAIARSTADHDILIDMRTDLKALRAEIKRSLDQQK